MSKIDFSRYSKLEEIVEDIKSVKIQGATNVAIATFEGLKLFLRKYRDDKPYELFLEDVEKAGVALAFARPNEPLAKNGLKFVTRMLKIRNPGLSDKEVAKQKVAELCEEYLDIIKSAKKKMIENSTSVLDETINNVFTHCHSSTAEAVIINQSKKVKDFTAVCTETRPLFQGRITATNLHEAGINTTMIADSAAESYIIGRGYHPVDVVFLGADEITMQGDAINKIGSWGVALAAYFASKPVYVIASILKTEVSTVYKPVKIEFRDAQELWDKAPKGLGMFNPAFEIVNRQFITGFITEIGVIKPEEIEKTIATEYEWLF